ncbi:MAG: DUF924 domain-containing protein [Myxococcales bacterium]|nr:DUF924 domain-containing protein [Myxococcales bacterium]
MASAEDVHAFWFGPQPATEPSLLRAKMQRWYEAGPAFDDQIRKKFGADVERALAGELDSWAATPSSRVSLIVVLDQFTRNIFRGTPRAFEGDKRAQHLAIEALESVLLYNHEERQFLIMPLLHAEDLALQEMSVHEMEAHVEAAPEPLRAIYAEGLDRARQYRDTIARFGRFPHRNAILGRPSTPEEEAADTLSDVRR